MKTIAVAVRGVMSDSPTALPTRAASDHHRKPSPADRASHSSPSAKSDVARPTAPMRLLLVDDDPVLLQSLQFVLASDGHLVTTTDGGQAGITEFKAAKSRGEPYALVITDLGMPKVDGRAVAAAVKLASPTTPVVLLTGWGQRLQDDKELPAHIDAVLSKPPRISELRAALAAWGHS